MAASPAEHHLLIVDAVNSAIGPVVVKVGEAVGYHFHDPHAPIPNFMVMIGIITVVITGVGLFIRSRLSVENPGKFQIIREDLVRSVVGLLEEWIGPKGARFLPLIATLGLFILIANYMGLVPGLMAPTSSINVTLGLALTTWVYYHVQGVKAQGFWAYLKHFAVPPGSPVLMAPLMLVIEIISHL